MMSKCVIQQVFFRLSVSLWLSLLSTLPPAFIRLPAVFLAFFLRSIYKPTDDPKNYKFLLPMLMLYLNPLFDLVSD